MDILTHNLRCSSEIHSRTSIVLNYIDDLPARPLYSVPRMFADDATFTISSCNPARKQSKLSSSQAIW